MPEPIRLLVADDHAVVREGLRLFLDLQPDVDVVGEAGDGSEVVEQARVLRPDVVLMDLAMPGTDGVQATRAVRDSCPHTRVLVLTSFSDEEHVVSALQAGACGYLMKDSAPGEVLAGVRAVSRGEPALAPEALRALVTGISRTAPPPEGTVTVVFTDIEGSTELFQGLGDGRARQVLREHDAILRTAIAHHGGVEVKRQGDGLMAAFASARRALRAAVEVQQALDERNALHPHAPVRVRIGMNTGEAIGEDGDYFGATVVVAARVAALADGGEILVSDITRRLVGPGAVAFVDRGEFRLKGLQARHRLHEAVWNGSPSS